MLAILLCLPRLAPPAVTAAAPAGEKLVALTFDDGPMGETTERLLDGLRERGVQATFFLIGRQAERYGDTVLKIARDGHQLGIHTYDHLCVQGMGAEQFFDQTERARRAVFRLVGEQELWLRPPYGLMDANTPRFADGPLILWSVDPEDWRDGDARRVCGHIAQIVRDGDIILLHDVYESSVDAALAAVDELTARGFRFVTVRELLDLRGIEPAAGAVVRRAAN